MEWLSCSVTQINLFFCLRKVFIFLSLCIDFLFIILNPRCSISRWPTPPWNGSRPASLPLPASQSHGSTSPSPSIASREEAHGSKSPPLCATQGRPRASRSPCPSRASPGSTRGSRSPPPPSNASQDKPHIRRRLEMQRSPQLSISGHVASKSSSHGLVEARESVHRRQNECTAGLLSCEYTVA